MSARTLAAVASAALLLALPACGAGGSSTGTSDSASSGTAQAGSDFSPAAAGADASAFPLTINHALGTTTIDKLPERVATVGWGNQEVPLALGVVPVGMSKVAWGDDDGDGVLPWVEAKLQELGAQTPALFDETDGIPYEAIAATSPDVILAAYSGLTQEEYDTLSKIAPVVAYPQVAWATSLEDMVALDAQALGLEAPATELLNDLDTQVATAIDKHPGLRGKKVLFTDSTGNDEQSLKDLQADPLLSKIPAIAAGHVAFLPEGPLGAAANQTPLSIPATMDDYAAALAAAL